MNRLLLNQFTPQIIRGALSRGLEWPALQAMGLRPQQLEKLLRPAGRLTERQASALERKTGYSIGQLAVLGVASERKAPKNARDPRLIADTLKLMGEFDAVVGTARRHNRRAARLGK